MICSMDVMRKAQDAASCSVATCLGMKCACWTYGKGLLKTRHSVLCAERQQLLFHFVVLTLFCCSSLA